MKEINSLVPQLYGIIEDIKNSSSNGEGFQKSIELFKLIFQSIEFEKESFSSDEILDISLELNPINEKIDSILKICLSRLDDDYQEFKNSIEEFSKNIEIHKQALENKEIELKEYKEDKKEDIAKYYKHLELNKMVDIEFENLKALQNEIEDRLKEYDNKLKEVYIVKDI